MILTDISVIGPEYAPPKPPQPPPPAQPWLDWLDQRILDLVGEYGPLKLWQALNLVSEEMSPRSRAAGREVRLKLWAKIRRLIGLGLVFRAGRNSVATAKPTRKPAGGRVRRRNRTVRQAAPNKAVSAVKSASPPEPGSTAFAVRAEVFVGNHGGQETPPTGPETECAPGPAEVSLAAKSLALLPRRPKRWSGWLNDRVRTYRNMRVELPGGQQVYAFGAKRGLLVYVREPDLCAGDPDERGKTWGVLPADQVQVIRNEAARLLGSLKRGTREAFSPAKVAAARANGRQPTRAGSRGRGRPSRHQAPYLPVSPQADPSGL